MTKKYLKSVFIFRRDLRLDDNTGLLAALEQSETVLCAFIFDDRQIDPKKNHYFSAPAFAFLKNSLFELNKELEARTSHLNFFKGDPKVILESLIVQENIHAVFVNNDYTPFSLQRDKELAEVCQKHQVTFSQHSDLTLSPVENIYTDAGKIYTVFTPFKNKAQHYPVATPQKNSFTNYYSKKIKLKTITLKEMSVNIGKRKLKLTGGRAEAVAILKEHRYLKNYKETRNFPALAGTSSLSAHHKFGTISIRESYYVAAQVSEFENQYISELYWRDFYYYIAYHFPKVFKKPFLSWAEHLAWNNNEEHFRAWCEGKTGVPIVDAGMRELNETGWMHNRARMICASYLTKNLLINWQWGEKYFAHNLIDYDPAQNNGGWQWSASTGADPRPLRIFNPYLQAKKYDPDAMYIKKWVTELKNVDPKKLTDGKEHDFSTLTDTYPPPRLTQKESYQKAVSTYKLAKKDKVIVQ